MDRREKEDKKEKKGTEKEGEGGENIQRKILGYWTRPTTT